MLSEIRVDEEFRKAMDVYRQPDTTKGLIEACRDNVVLYAERMKGIRLYSWQIYVLVRLQRVLNEKDPVKLAAMCKRFLGVTSRQIGKSTLLDIFNEWAAEYNKYPGTLTNATQIGVVSATDQQAKKLLRDTLKTIRIGDKHMENTYVDEQGNPIFGKNFFTNLLDDSEPNNTTTITFKTWKDKIHGPYLLAGSKAGSWIKSFPPTSIVLGETLTILEIDEAGKSDKITDEFHDDCASPTITSTDGLKILMSTPWQTSGFFYEAADPDDRKAEHEYERFMFTCEAIKDENPKQYAVIQQEIKELEAAGKHDTVQRAYYCRFVKGETSYFDPEHVMDVFTSDYQMYAAYDGICDIGLDYGGQVTSRTVVTVTAEIDGEIKRLYHRAYPVGQDLSLLQDLETDIMKRFPRWQRIIPDDCPAGDFLNRTMKEKGWNVLPMNFRTDKVKKYGAFRARVNKGQVVSYQDPELKIEMLAMEFSQGSKQSILQHAPGYTDDLIDSFVMSAYFYLQEEGGVKVFDWNVETPQELAIREGRVANDTETLLQRIREKRKDVYGW